MKLRPAAQIGHHISTLFEAVSLDLPNPLVFANFSTQCDAATRRSLLSRYLPSHVDMPAVNLLRYPSGTLVYGDRSYLTVAGGAIVAEQVAPWCADPLEEAERMCATSDQAHDVHQDCLLLARFGENTWGHWVAEMLVKAAIAERFFPGKFFYAVPWWTTERTEKRGFADAVLESLAAYGILPDRLVRMGGLQMYRFAALHDITGFWQDGPHPGALESLQTVVLARTRARRQPRLALLRRPPDARAVANADEIESHLKAQGFAAVDLTTQTFSAQLRLFREADLVVGSLGSNFTGAIFGERAKKMISLAPASWADGYFIRLFQHLGAHHVDLRGPSILQNGEAPDRASHHIDTNALAGAMAALLQPDLTMGTAGARRVDGELMPSRLGPPILNLSFQEDGDGAVQFTGDWSGQEPTHRWSLGPRSEMSFPRRWLPREGVFWLEIEGQGHVYPPRMPTRPMDVLVNGKPTGRFDVIGRARYFCHLTTDMLAGSDRTSLTFLHPVCPSPRMMGAGEDDRPLGFGFEKLAIYAAA